MTPTDKIKEHLSDLRITRDMAEKWHGSCILCKESSNHIQVIENLVDAIESCQEIIYDPKYGQSAKWLHANIAGVCTSALAECAEMLGKNV